VRRFVVSVVIMVAAALSLAPAASAALQTGNYNVNIPDRRDFHTWIWSAVPCNPPSPVPGQCTLISAIAQPIAKAYPWYSNAVLANGQYTLTVDVPDGLRCGDIYYGPVIPTHDVYTFDANTLSGTLQSSFDAGCDGAPGGTFTYPFSLTRL
jgi:hypothetical protein